MSQEFSTTFHGQSLDPNRRLDIIRRFFRQGLRGDTNAKDTSETLNEEQSRHYGDSDVLWSAGTNVKGAPGCSVEYYNKLTGQRAKVFFNKDLEFIEGEKSSPRGMARASRLDADALLCMLEVETTLQSFALPGLRSL